MTAAAPSIPAGVIRWGSLPVPYVAAWSSESEVVIRRDLLIGGRPALFRTGRRGLGVPRFGFMDESRCRAVVAKQLCQICAKPIKGGGIVCDVAIDRTRAGEPILSEPPACERCFAVARVLCPGIAKLLANPRVIFARVRRYQVVVAPLRSVGAEGTPEVEAALAAWQGAPPVGYARPALVDYELLPRDAFAPAGEVRP